MAVIKIDFLHAAVVNTCLVKKDPFTRFFMVIRDLFLKVDANDDVIQYGRRACAVRGAKEALILLIARSMFFN